LIDDTNSVNRKPLARRLNIPGCPKRRTSIPTTPATVLPTSTHLRLNKANRHPLHHQTSLTICLVLLHSHRTRPAPRQIQLLVQPCTHICSSRQGQLLPPTPELPDAGRLLSVRHYDGALGISWREEWTLPRERTKGHSLDSYRPYHRPYLKRSCGKTHRLPGSGSRSTLGCAGGRWRLDEAVCLISQCAHL
jgi:hypothetical protein